MINKRANRIARNIEEQAEMLNTAARRIRELDDINLAMSTMQSVLSNMAINIYEAGIVKAKTEKVTK